MQLDQQEYEEKGCQTVVLPDLTPIDRNLIGLHGGVLTGEKVSDGMLTTVGATCVSLHG